MKITLKTLAEIIDAQIIGDETVLIDRIDSLDSATSGAIGYFINPKFRVNLGTTKASAIILKEDAQSFCSTNMLVVKDPQLAFAQIATFLYPPKHREPNIHPSAVTEGATLDSSVVIGAHVVIGKGSVIAANVQIEAGCVIGEDVSIGKNTHLKGNVSIYDDTEIGADCLIHSGVVLGSDGFGFAQKDKEWFKIPQIGHVVIGDRVEIGANTVIDCGTLKNTIVKAGAKLDNLIHLAHNVEIGENSALAACVAIAGSTKIGQNCTFGGVVAITGHIEIADNIFVTGATPVTRSLKKAGVYSGNVAVMENKAWRKSNARFRKLDEMYKRISALEKIIESKTED